MIRKSPCPPLGVVAAPPIKRVLAPKLGWLAGSFGSVLWRFTSAPSRKLSSSEFSLRGSVPVSLLSTKVPEFDSTPSRRPSLSESGFKGFVPFVDSAPSLLPSSSLSGSPGKVKLWNSSRLFEPSESGSRRASSKRGSRPPSATALLSYS